MNGGEFIIYLKHSRENLPAGVFFEEIQHALDAKAGKFYQKIDHLSPSERAEHDSLSYTVDSELQRRKDLLEIGNKRIHIKVFRDLANSNDKIFAALTKDDRVKLLNLADQIERNYPVK